MSTTVKPVKVEAEPDVTWRMWVPCMAMAACSWLSFFHRQILGALAPPGWSIRVVVKWRTAGGRRRSVDRGAAWPKIRMARRLHVYGRFRARLDGALGLCCQTAISAEG